MKAHPLLSIVLGLTIAGPGAIFAEDPGREFAPSKDEQQLPFAMHAKMEQLPRIRVGQQDADLIGRDNRALQAGVDYIAALGGGVVEVGPGEYVMHDSLHLRSNVTVKGSPGQTILRKAVGVVSTLALDGDFGEQQLTVDDPTQFDVGYGVAIWDDNAGEMSLVHYLDLSDTLQLRSSVHEISSCRKQIYPTSGVIAFTALVDEGRLIRLRGSCT
ncbi:MAG: hypothetical protein WDZ59_09520 [Pirellulales bacterium]